MTKTHLTFQKHIQDDKNITCQKHNIKGKNTTKKTQTEQHVKNTTCPKDKKTKHNMQKHSEDVKNTTKMIKKNMSKMQ